MLLLRALCVAAVQVDFLLTAMRQLAATRPDLKLLLMSATVDTQKLMDYFGSSIAGVCVCVCAELAG